MESSQTHGRAPDVTLSVHARTDVGMARSNNEDAFAVVDLARGQAIETTTRNLRIDVGASGVLLVVSDGMGGAAFGEVAARLSIAAFRNALADRILVAPPDRAMRESVALANAAVWEDARSPERKGMGATLVAVLVHDLHAYFTEVGDSRAYVLRDGRLEQVSRDQSYTQMLIDAGALKPEDVGTFPMKNVVVQAMGATATVDAPLRRLPLRHGDRLLLCSDGLSGLISDEAMSEILYRNPSAGDPVEHLVAAANAAGGPDNITVILAEVSGDGLAKPTKEETLAASVETIHAFKANDLP
jgi:serine/threonine protein phosphatase PrpC